jgi:hypothetical protein
MQVPGVSTYVAHILFKTNVGTLADQLHILCFIKYQHHIRFVFEQLSYGIMSGMMFLLMG